MGARGNPARRAALQFERTEPPATARRAAQEKYPQFVPRKQCRPLIRGPRNELRLLSSHTWEGGALQPLHRGDLYAAVQGVRAPTARRAVHAPGFPGNSAPHTPESSQRANVELCKGIRERGRAVRQRSRENEREGFERSEK